MDAADEVIVVKWGGSLITEKSKMLTPRRDVMSSLARVFSAYFNVGEKRKRIVLVHGAGSFGHLRSKIWRLAEGRLPAETFDNVKAGDSFKRKAKDQTEAVSLVRQEMLQLNGYVCDALVKEGIQTRVHPPHLWARNTGPAFHGNIKDRFLHPKTGNQEGKPTIDITFGDVVDVDNSKCFGILSGDDLVVRLCQEIPNVKRLVFLIGGGVDGMLSKAPSEGGTNEEHLLRELRPSDMDFSNGGFHGAQWASSIDVTGGIGLKAARGMLVAQDCGIDVLVINGELPNRILAGLRGGDVIGTRILSQHAERNKEITLAKSFTLGERSRL